MTYLNNFSREKINENIFYNLLPQFAAKMNKNGSPVVAIVLTGAVVLGALLLASAAAGAGSSVSSVSSVAGGSNSGRRPTSRSQ